MIEALYYTEPYKKTFETQVVSCEPEKEGYKITIEETGFYPEGGGQPADQGSFLNLLTQEKMQVLHVWQEKEKVYHLISQPLRPGDQIEGRIDFKSRYDWMQQHSGEHILSGIIAKKYGFSNIGFHMNKEITTADYDGLLTWEDCEALENEVNKAIVENIPITAQIYDPKIVETINYRSKKVFNEPIRLVKIGEYDYCACCGLHVGRTGEIGLFKIVGIEKYKQGTRLTLLCGARALKDYQVKHSQAQEISRLLSVKANALIVGIQRLQEEQSSLKQKLVDRTQLFLETQEMLYEPNRISLRKLDNFSASRLFLLAKGFDSDERRRYCLHMVEITRKVCMIVSPEKNFEQGDFIYYAIGCPADQDIRHTVKELNMIYSGKGGGKATFCQGSLVGSLEEIKENFLQME